MSDWRETTDKPAEDTLPESTTESLSSRGMRAMHGESSESRHEWKDHGIVDVPVSDLPMPEHVSGPADFDHHISYQDALAATRQLPEIQKQLSAGKTGDDFSAADQAAGRDYAHGQRRIYDLYYGSDPVVLDKIGDKYDIVSGRHRIFAAKELGSRTIPARLREKR